MEGSTTLGFGASATFRDSDAEFLQTEAREWLEAVLDEKLDPQTSLQDLLADGTVLYKVSQIVREGLSKAKGHPENPPAALASISSPDVKWKHGLKYQPYSYVEAFLKVCKDVGLLDLDLFNPSDAVDKKDIRHVCVCLRRFSMKARKLNILLPDFDNPKHMLASPHKHPVSTEGIQVHGLRDSLQQPNQKTPSSTSSTVDFQKGESDLNGASLASDAGSEKSEDEIVAPDDESVAPDDESVAPADKVVASDDESIAPDDESIAPADKVVALDDEIVAPEGEAVALEDEVVALEEIIASRGPSHEESMVSAKQAEETIATSVSDEADLRPVTHTATSEMPCVSGSYKVGPTEVLEQNGAKEEEREKRKGRGYSWFPYAAGVVVFVGAIVVMVVVRARRRSSPVVYEIQPGDFEVEISRRAGRSSWQEIMQRNPNIHNPHLIRPNERLML